MSNGWKSLCAVGCCLDPHTVLSDRQYWIYGRSIGA
jgi:hypothetical protein